MVDVSESEVDKVIRAVIIDHHVGLRRIAVDDAPLGPLRTELSELPVECRPQAPRLGVPGCAVGERLRAGSLSASCQSLRGIVEPREERAGFEHFAVAPAHRLTWHMR